MSAIAVMGALVASACFCSDESLCKPLTTVAKKEVVSFSTSGAEWKNYNMSGLTTIMTFGTWDPQMLCAAHAAGVKVVPFVFYDKKQLPNETYTAAWIETTAQMIKNNFTDGINFDIEGNSANRDQLTQLVTRTANRLKQDNPNAQITFDTMIYPSSTNQGYDFVALNKVLTFFIPMAYDMCWGTKTAKPNSPIAGITEGIQKYKDLGIDASRIVLGLPWYGWDFICTEKPQAGKPCSVVSPFGGASWQKGYDTIRTSLIPKATSTPIYTASNDAIWFNYESAGEYHQVYFDDPKTIGTKAEFIRQNGLMGAAVWTTAMAVDLPADNPMWEALCSVRY
eukprot:TRINITY_DN3334_c0_g1_i2.p1 TRINITY_DN3334_c0_g1~~TRINITY_DN3334_c0_g1_i2.p1  ORF type:complete len:353 (+),score=70.14 TRINITY_DN3334_c0_g1_i2:46-1059(+)